MQDLQLEDLQQFLETLDSGQLMEFSDTLGLVHTDLLALLAVADYFSDDKDYFWTKTVRDIRQKLLKAIQICEQVEATETTEGFR